MYPLTGPHLSDQRYPLQGGGVLIVRAPESRLWGSGWRFNDRFALFVKLTYGTDEGAKHSRHGGPVAFGERFQQLILVLTETTPQNPVFFLQISCFSDPLHYSENLLSRPSSPAGGTASRVERKCEDLEPESWWAGRFPYPLGFKSQPRRRRPQRSSGLAG